MDIGALITLCNTTIAAGAKVLEKFKGTQFSEPERELLVSAAGGGGCFHIMSVAQVPGSWVRAGNREDFMDQEDPSHAALYFDAFRLLCERGLIMHECGGMFVLTGVGWEKARSFAGED